MGLLDGKLFTTNVSSAPKTQHALPQLPVFISLPKLLFFFISASQIHPKEFCLNSLYQKFSNCEAEKPDDAHRFCHNTFPVYKPDLLRVQYLRTTGQL